jgi:hypothetical protein
MPSEEETPVARYRSDSDPTSVWDEAGGEESAPERAPRRSPRRSARPQRDLTRGDRPQSRAQRNVRPEEVSERVWEMADQWLELGEAHFGKRPPVNRQEFSKRLSAKINSDPNLRKWLKIRPERWQSTFGGKWEAGSDFVNDVLARAVEMFWRYLTNDQSNSASLQFAFLDDEWDEWIYQATTAVKVEWAQRKGDWSKPELPSAVFDPATVGRPEADEPCKDPLFEGMTWGEVWALDDREMLSERSEEPIARPKHASLESPKRAIVANHHTTAKETTDD